MEILVYYNEELKYTHTKKRKKQTTEKWTKDIKKYFTKETGVIIMEICPTTKEKTS